MENLPQPLTDREIEVPVLFPLMFGHRISTNESRLVGVSALVLVVSLVGFGGFLTGWMFWPGRPAGATLFEDPPTRAPELRPVTEFPPEDYVQVYALYWSGESVLWFVESRGDMTLKLSRLNVGDGSVASWPLPAQSVKTPHTYLAEDSAGLLWVGTGYVLAAFDPQRNEFVASEALPLEHPLATAGALTPGDPNPGTWINGLMRDSSGQVLLTRNNVRAVFGASTDGVQSARELSEPPSGLRLDGGAAVPFARSDDGVKLFDSEGRPAVSAPSLSMSMGGCSVATDDLGRATITSTAWPDPVVLPGIVDPRAPLALNAGKVAIGVVRTGAVVVGDCQGGPAREFTLGGVLAIPDGPGALVGGSPSNVEPIVQSRLPDALALSEAGRLAVSSDAGIIFLLESE